MHPDRKTALIIGAGHNGLVAAFYLARRGWKVKLLERRAVVGGAAVTEEFQPGFRNSIASYTVGLLHPDILRDMDLQAQGLRIVERPIANFLPLPDGRFLKMGGDLSRSQAEVAKFSARDAHRLPAYLDLLRRIAGPVRALAAMPPPRLDGSWRDLPALLRHARLWQGIEAGDRARLLNLISSSASAFLGEWFESEPLKAVFGFDSMVGNYTSPHRAGSAYTLLHHVFGEVNGRQGSWGHAIGGMGAITQAMWRACAALGVELQLNAPVRRVQVEQGRAVGVELEDGSVHRAAVVLANVNPKLLFSRLVDAGTLNDDDGVDYDTQLAQYRTGSGTLRINVALSELPQFSALPGEGEHHQSGIILAPSLDHMDRAWRDATRQGWSAAPIIEMMIPSTVDDSLAPRGAHVASLFCQHFAARLPDGGSWDDHRERVADLVVDAVTQYAPNFRRAVIGRQVLTPLDLERVFGLTDGDIMHGRLTLDQLWAARPAVGYGSYRTPVQGLYLCGSGAHPGGGVTGLPGRNAAAIVAREVR